MAEEPIENLNLPTIISNALHGTGVQTIGELKDFIRRHGCSGLRHVGISGWHNIAEKLYPYTSEDTDVRPVLEEILGKGKYCRILQKNCPADGNCNGCELYLVYQKFTL